MKIIRNFQNYFRYLSVGSFLARRQISRGNIWITLLIIAIMTLTFLSLVVIPGILIGIIQGSSVQNKEHFTGDLYLTTLPDESSIVNTQDIIRVLSEMPEVKHYTVRYQIGATIETGYINRPDFTKESEKLSVNAYAINPGKETATTNIDKFMVEGEMLEDGESGYIVIGSTLLAKYSSFADLFEPLRDVQVGKPIKVTLQGRAMDGFEADQALRGNENETNGQTTEFIVKGILKSKVGELSSAVFISEQDYRRISGMQSMQAKQIVIKHDRSLSDDEFKKIALHHGFDKHAKVQTAREAIPKFLDDMQKTFAMLGNLIGLIGIVVSSITIFIVIYINALTRRKFIGILKGIGISEKAIEAAYLMQALFYALVGIGIGLLIVYGLLVPAFQANPVDFPFSDGILVAPIAGTLGKALFLIGVTVIAGFLPARLIVRKNTLDSILQR